MSEEQEEEFPHLNQRFAYVSAKIRCNRAHKKARNSILVKRIVEKRRLLCDSATVFIFPMLASLCHHHARLHST